LFVNSPILATSFTEIWGLFSINVPQGWIYQMPESSEDLLVFYGSGEHDLIYIENLGLIEDQSAVAFAERVMVYYESINGLPGFCRKTNIHETQVAGLTVAEVVYHYQGRIPTTEKRLFALINGEGISITYSNALEEFWINFADFDNFLAGWRWLMIE